MENLFSYGTLQRDEVQVKLFGRLLSGSKDILKGYEVLRIEIKDEAFLAKGEDKFQQTLVFTGNEDDFVEGIVFVISGEELFLSDKYEPDNYKRTEITLQSGRQAWVYVADEIF